MANTQINIDANGKTTLATAGKYCDRNIDVNVSVSGGGVQPTQFTNLYDPANVTLDYYIPSSGNLDALTASTDCNVLKIPYNHAAGQPVELRLRGLCTVRARAYIAVSTDGVSRAYTQQWHNCGALSFDEYGDAVWTATSSKGVVTNAWKYLHINFQYPYVLSGDAQMSGPIVTINEPIGNGGVTT